MKEKGMEKAVKAGKATNTTQVATATKSIPRIDQEFKTLIPPLSAEEREQLEQNILAKRRCHDAITVWEGVILDGHNRFEICVTHGIEFEVKEVELSSREEAKVWIIDNQLGRRNLNEAMRIELVLLKEEVMRVKARKRLSDAGKKGRPGGMSSAGEGMHDGKCHVADGGTNAKEKPFPKMEKPQIPGFHVDDAMTAEAQVGKGTLNRYIEIKQHANPELLAKVLSGALKIGTAHRMLTKEIMKRLSTHDRILKSMVSAIPPAGLMATNPKLHQDLAELYQSLNELIKTLGARNTAKTSENDESQRKEESK